MSIAQSNALQWTTKGCSKSGAYNIRADTGAFLSALKAWVYVIVQTHSALECNKLVRDIAILA